MILPVDLGLDAVGDELGALLVDDGHRLQRRLAPEMARGKVAARHDGDGDAAIRTRPWS